MKKIILILLSIILFNKNVFAVTLSEALWQAYSENPELNAERENIQVSREDVKISRSAFNTGFSLYACNNAFDKGIEKAFPLKRIIDKNIKIIFFIIF